MTRELVLPGPGSAGLRLDVAGEIAVDWDLVDEYFPAGAAATASLPVRLRRGVVAPGAPVVRRVETFPGVWYDTSLDASGAWVHTAAAGDHTIVCRFDGATTPTSIELVIAPGYESRATSLIMYVARDVLQHRLRAAGFAMLHAAVVARDGRAIALVGDKGAGKSSWLLRALTAGWNLVANDRSLVALDRPEPVVAFPIASMISPAGLRNLPPALRARIDRREIRRRDGDRPSSNGKTGLTSHELASAFGVAAVWGAPLAALVFLHGSAGAIELAPSIDAAARLGENLYTPRDPTYAYDWLCRPTPGAPVGADTAAAALLARVPAWTLRFSWPAFDAAPGSAADVLAQIAATLDTPLAVCA